MCDVTCFFYEYSHEAVNQLWLRPFGTYVYARLPRLPVYGFRAHLAYGTCTRRDFVSVEQRKRCVVVSGVCSDELCRSTVGGCAAGESIYT